MDNKITYIDKAFIDRCTDYDHLISALRGQFAERSAVVPPRHHHDFPNSEVGADSTLLLMPAWQDGLDAGVKIVTVNPENHRFSLPAIFGNYLYMDAVTGQVMAILDAKAMTAHRTAAASALASSYLSNPDASAMLMMGTGALSAVLIKAHATVRPLRKVFVWGRNFEKARTVANSFEGVDYSVIPVDDFKEVITEVDIISTATLSKTPLFDGKLIRPGQHLDLVGSYKPDMREVDNIAITKSTLFVDVKEMATKESGDMYIPLSEATISMSDIQADLFDLCSGMHQGRQNKNQITLFKSVGHALEDLVAARYYYGQFLQA